MTFRPLLFAILISLFGLVGARSQESAGVLPESSDVPAKCWDFEEPDAVLTEFGADGSAVFAATNAGGVIALDAATGERLWKAEFGGEAASNVAVGRDLVAVATRPVPSTEIPAPAVTLRVMSKETGVVVWSKPLAGKGDVYLLATEDLLVAATNSGETAALDARTGSTKWKVIFSSGLSAAPLVNGGDLLTSTIDKRLIGLTLAGGETQFSAELLNASTELFAGNGAIISADPRGEISRYDLSRVGKARWKYRAGARITKMTAADGDLFAASFDNFLYSIGEDSGHVNWKIRLPSRVLEVVKIGGKRLLVLVANSKTAAVVDSDNGRLITQLALDTEPLAALNISGRVLILSSTALSAYSLQCKK